MHAVNVGFICARTMWLLATDAAEPFVLRTSMAVEYVEAICAVPTLNGVQDAREASV